MTALNDATTMIAAFACATIYGADEFWRIWRFLTERLEELSEGGR